MENRKMKDYLYKLYNISSRVQQIRCTDIKLGASIMLNTAALSTLDVIQQNQDKNMSEISSIMGITKGAISQMALKLEKKGVIQKHKSEYNDKNYFMRLTPKGMQALEEYHSIHDRLYHGMSEVLSNYQKEEIEVIWKFLYQTNQFMDKFKSDISYEENEKSAKLSSCDNEFMNIRRK